MIAGITGVRGRDHSLIPRYFAADRPVSCKRDRSDRENNEANKKAAASFEAAASLFGRVEKRFPQVVESVAKLID